MKQFGVWQSTRGMISCILAIIFAVPSSLPAQNHVVSPAELRKDLVAASRARQHNADTITGFLSSTRAEKALRAAQIDLIQVKMAVSALSDQELAQLAARSEKAQADLVAGRLSERDLLIILLGVAALILIIVAVR